MRGVATNGLSAGAAAVVSRNTVTAVFSAASPNVGSTRSMVSSSVSVTSSPPTNTLGEQPAPSFR